MENIVKILDEEMYGQCAWCAVVESGPYEGAVVAENEKETHLVLFEEYSHGICPVCDARLRGTRRFRKTYSGPLALTDGEIVPYRG